MSNAPIDTSYQAQVTPAQWSQLIRTIRDLGHIPQDVLVAIAQQANRLPTIITGSAPPSGTYDALTADCPLGLYFRRGATADTTVYITVNAGTDWYVLPFGPLVPGDITLAQNKAILGNLSGVGEAVDPEDMPVSDVSSFIATDTIAGILAGLIATAGGTSSTVRNYSTPLVLTDNQTLYASLLAIDTWFKSLRLTLPVPTDVTITGGGAFAFDKACNTIRGAGGMADDLVSFSGLRDGETRRAVCGAEVITVKDGATVATERNADLVLATGDIIDVTLHGTVHYVKATFLQNGLPDTELADIPDAGSYYTQTGLAAMLQELFSSAIGGTNSTTRAFNSVALADVADNEDLALALGHELQTRRDEFAKIVLDDATPSATAGRGLVFSGCDVTPQAGPDNTVIVALGVAYNQLGRRVPCTSTPVLAATTPNGLGGNRYDIVVIPAAGGAPVIREGTVITTDPTLAAGDVPLARLTCAPGAFTIAGGDIADLRQTARTIAADKLLPASAADLLVLLATDQITNAVLIQAILDGAFQADADTRALFADLIWTDAKLAQDRGKTSAMVIGAPSATTDITGGAATRDINVTIDGTGPINVEIAKAGLNTGALIASALQVAIRAANAAFAKAEVRYLSTGRYVVTTGSRGSATAITLAAGTANDVGAAMLLLAANGAQTVPGADNLDDAISQARSVWLSGYPATYVAGNTATPVGQATVTLSRHLLNILTPAAPGAYNVANFAGLAAGEWADIAINDPASPATIQHAGGGGNIRNHRAIDNVMAATADRIRVTYDGTVYTCSQPTLAAGQTSGAAGTGATGGTTATNAAEFRTGQVVYACPIAEELITVSADAPLNADGARVLTAGVTALTIPDVPRCLAIRATIAVNPITAGVARVVGKDASYKNVTEDVSLVTAVSATFRTTKAYSEITSITIVGLVGGGGAGDNLSVGQAVGFGLPAHGSLTASMFSGIVTSVAADVDSVPAREAVAGYDAANGWVAPTTAPDGTKVYWLLYTYQVTVAQNSHTHPGPSHSHLV